jgi:PD-(D/E)XK nuclease superfamily
LKTLLFKVIIFGVNERGGPKILFRKEVYTIVGAALEVLRELGHGIHEKPYERALAVEFRAS